MAQLYRNRKLYECGLKREYLRPVDWGACLVHKAKRQYNLLLSTLLEYYIVGTCANGTYIHILTYIRGH